MVQSIKELDDKSFEEKFQKVREERGEMYDADGNVTPAWEYPHKDWLRQAFYRPDGIHRSGIYPPDRVYQEQIIEWHERDQDWLRRKGYTYTDWKYRQPKPQRKGPSPEEIRRRTLKAIEQREDISELSYIDMDLWEREMGL